MKKKVMKKKVLILLLLLLVIAAFCIKKFNDKPPYQISEENVKSIYLEYDKKGTTISLPVSNLEKKDILSEVSKMREKETYGQIGTVLYRFIIELKDGHKVTFNQNTGDVIELYSDIDKRTRTIKAPKTAALIKRYIKDNNIDM